MSEARGVLPSWLALVPVLLVTLPSQAELPAASEPSATTEDAVRFQFEAPAGCPDAAVFTARVRERTSRGRLAEPGELARTFNVKVTGAPQGFTGQIEFLDDNGAPVNRRLSGEQCDAVVSSLALITALALDATLREPEPASEPAAAALPVAEPPPAPPPIPPKSGPRASAPPPPAPPPPPPKGLRARIGFGGAYGTSLRGPERFLLAQQGSLIGQLEWGNGPALRVAAHLDQQELTVDAGRVAELRILAVESSVCPLQLRTDDVALYPCAVVDLGSLHGEGRLGENLTTANGETIFWASVGAEVRGLVESATLPIWLELRAGVGFPLVATHQFVFRNPQALVYEVPHVTGVGGLSFGVRFW